MRIESFAFDAREPAFLARWWADALGWVIVFEDPKGEEVNVAAEVRGDGSHPYPELSFFRIEHPEEGQEKIHLDLNSHSEQEQVQIVERLLAQGATYRDVGQAADAAFRVLADPEGNSLCVLEPRPETAHLGSLAGFTLAAHDAHRLRGLWLAASGWRLRSEDPGYVVLVPPCHDGANFEIISRPTMPEDTRKNRVHVDVAPSADQDQGEVVALLERLGATRTDVGQRGDESWVVLADQEGNELCVLSPSH